MTAVTVSRYWGSKRAEGTYTSGPSIQNGRPEMFVKLAARLCKEV